MKLFVLLLSIDVVCTFWRQVLCQVCVANISLPVCGLPVHPLNHDFGRAKVLNFDRVQCIKFFFYSLCFFVSFLRKQWHFKNLFTVVSGGRWIRHLWWIHPSPYQGTSLSSFSLVGNSLPPCFAHPSITGGHMHRTETASRSSFHSWLQPLTVL